jgi:hypothetical protein
MGAPVAMIVIDQSTSRVAQGEYQWDRANGGILIPPSGSSFPGSPEAGECFWNTSDDKLYRRNDANTAWVVIPPEIDGLTNESGVDKINDTVAFYDSSAAAVRKTAIANLREFPTGYLYGFPMYNNASNPAYQIDIGPGVCRSSDDTTDLALTTTLTVDITTSGANGLDTGSELSWVWYYIYLIYNPTTSTYASLLSESSTSPSLPSGYTKHRRLGSVINNGSSNFRNFRCQYRLSRDRVFMYNDEDEDDVQLLSGGTATSWTDIYAGASVPPTSLLGLFLFRFYSKNYDWKCLVRPGDSSQDSPPTTIYGGGDLSGDFVTVTVPFEMRLSSGRDISYKHGSTGGQLSVWCLGYTDFV